MCIKIVILGPKKLLPSNFDYKNSRRFFSSVFISSGFSKPFRFYLLFYAKSENLNDDFHLS